MAAKRQDTVANSLKIVVQRIPKIKWLVVGLCGEYVDHPLATIHKGQTYMTLVGSISHEELPDYYNLCDLFILPSRPEGFGRVYIEALACGKPVIGGAGTGATEALLDGRLGLLVDPDDVCGLAQAIINVIEGKVEPHLLDPEYLRKTVLEHYSFKRFIERVEGLLTTILEGKGKIE
jgi:glycosyltransferase involved in cell wall biosynthesis